MGFGEGEGDIRKGIQKILPPGHNGSQFPEISFDPPFYGLSQCSHIPAGGIGGRIDQIPVILAAVRIPAQTALNNYFGEKKI